MDAFAGPLWMGLVPVVLVVTRRSWLSREGARLWLLVIAVFAAWALGPYLLVLGVETGLPMPQILLRFVPVVSNARIPGHAVILVYLGAAVLLAMALSALRARAVTGVLALILVDFTAAPIATHALERPALYAHLAALPQGAVLELPFGIRDGFGEQGQMDPASLYYQTIHGKPLLGGYVSRLSPAVRERYAAAPFDTLLALSTGAPPSATAVDVAAMLERVGTRYIVLDEARAPATLRMFVREMPLSLIRTDGRRHLYAWSSVD
jgi:hypothetical protein